MNRSTVLCAAFLLATAIAFAGTNDSTDAVYTAAEKARAAQLELLKKLVNIDSGTGDVADGRKVAAALIPELRALGATVETLPAEAPNLPENVVATLKGSGK